MNDAPRLFCFGLGYVAERLARTLAARGWQIAGTAKDPGRLAALHALGFEAHAFDGTAPMADAERALAGTTHMLVSVPAPRRDDGPADPVLTHHRADIAALSGLSWLGYLSTTGVYGDTGGAPVDETAPRRPTSARSRARVRAEDGWLDLWRTAAVPVHLFRLAGIYGPGRSPLDKVRNETARRIVKPGHRFGRIHVDDIVATLTASMARPDPGAAYNLADDEPAPPAEVTALACTLLGVPLLPEEPFEIAARTMSPMALSFWRDNRLILNRRIKDDLGVVLKHPTYREGLRAILAEERIAGAR